MYTFLLGIGQLQFNEIRKRILRLGIEMATSAQRDRFVENPVDQVRFTRYSVDPRLMALPITIKNSLNFRSIHKFHKILFRFD